MTDPEQFRDLVEQSEQLQDDLDFDRESRHDEGWIRFYVECPACEVPMARTTVESSMLPASDSQTRSKARFHCICPECGAMESLVTVYRDTHPVGDDASESP